ncbi:MAG TPA: PEP-CTERM sorting domain-containing protein [Acidobacteriaceae bacterium]|jgi:hypothetical protein|nr:PEP-CTERM sorting domain-containing protein [Acidobacteriaceae bacterium]
MMKSLRSLLAATLLCGLTVIANAAPVNFQVIVIDPPTGPVTITNSTPQPLTVSWQACTNPSLPASFIDCFSAVNDTGHDITSLSLFIPLSSSDPSQACPDTAGSLTSIFSQRDCTNVSGGLLMNFSGGTLNFLDHDDRHEPDGDDANTAFTIAVSLADPNLDLPDGTLMINSPLAPTPEPNSLLLLSTGLLGGAMILGNRRRRIGKSVARS